MSMLQPRHLIGAALVATTTPLPSLAQQLQHQPGLIPGSPRWSEGVEAADVDADGDLDLFFADGEGFVSPGTKRQNVLVVNQLVETGALTFADESLARLGAHSSHAKGVTTGDVDGDGWVDALFSNAFDTDPAFLYVNQGAANPGYFSFEGAARGFTTPVSSGGAMFADVDDDGDLDVVMNNNYLGTGSGKPRLYRNDGAGFFSLDSAAFAAAPDKSAHMDVQMVDVDGDFDVDLFGANRAGNGGAPHFLMTNDGQGTFSDVSAVLPATSASVYEAEVGDLDGDRDIDLFFVSLAGFSEGALRNDLAPSGSLGFTSQGAFGGDDDNEIALFDHDVDGDYDVVVGSLGAREKLYRNDGSFAFAAASSLITAVSDSTLDCTLADLDNDGRYDLITAQGESNPAQWANKVYLNVSGAQDRRAPVVTDLRSPLVASPLAPVVVHAKARDQVLDDGVDHLSAEARSVALAAPLTVNVALTAGGFSPPSSNVASGTGLVFTNGTGAAQTLTCSTAPWSWSVTLQPGQAYERFFVTPTTYAIDAAPAGASATVTVAGNVDTTRGLRAGVGQYRFALPNPLGPGGAQLVYELELVDWAGNRAVTSNGVVELVDCGPSSYCTSKPSSIPGCTPSLSGSGAPSATAGSGFVLTAGPMPGANSGLFVYTTNGAASSPIQNVYGFLCIQTGPGMLRFAGQKASGTPGACDGQLSVDFNAYFAAQTNDPALVPGARVDVQAWYRDPASPGAANLTDALTFVVCP
jgi:hypothetical protein